MQKIIRFFCLGILLLTSTYVFAADNEFKKNNVDVYKYEFARSYISALNYFYVINERWSSNPPKKKFKGDDLKTIRGSMEYLIQDNSDLRVSKNYMV